MISPEQLVVLAADARTTTRALLRGVVTCAVTPPRIQTIRIAESAFELASVLEYLELWQEKLEHEKGRPRPASNH